LKNRELGQLSQYAMGYGVADQLGLITKKSKREILGNQQAMYEVVKALTTETFIS
jgi:hypothetical protein